MEHISKSLAKLPRHTRDQKSSGKVGHKEEQPTETDDTESKLKRFNISSLNHTFESFKVIPATEKAWEVMRMLASGDSKLQFVLLNGATGSGKTHLIEASVIVWAKRGLLTRYYTFSEIARSLKTALRPNPERYDALFATYRDMERLIVDDIGMGTTESRFEISDLEDIIDWRYRKRYYPNNHSATIIATNKDITELPDRIVSRFYDPEFGEVLYLGDKDYRRRQNR